jgi:hypothetical protein
MTHADPNDQLAQDERRHDERRPGTDQVSLRVGDLVVTGRLENLSEGGVFVVLDESLSVEVELGATRGVPPRMARLVRCQALPGGKSGWGLQFENEGQDD